MATKPLHPPISTSHVLPSPPTLRKITKTRPQKLQKHCIPFRSNFAIKVAEQRSSLIGDHKDEDSTTNHSTISQIKADINNTLQGINRGIFGIPSEKKSEIEEMVKVLESLNTNPHPTLDLDKLGGCWKLIYSTITILGSKRTKLGLRDFINLGDFLQVIDVAKVPNPLFLPPLISKEHFSIRVVEATFGSVWSVDVGLGTIIVQGKAVNVIMFNVRGLNLFSGKLIIEASFTISSKSRVDIQYNSSTIVPDQLMNMFRKNYDVLLSIFNPDGWLEITYVDETLRIGRDDKGNIFILERSNETDP